MSTASGDNGKATYFENQIQRINYQLGREIEQLTEQLSTLLGEESEIENEVEKLGKLGKKMDQVDMTELTSEDKKHISNIGEEDRKVLKMISNAREEAQEVENRLEEIEDLVRRVTVNFNELSGERNISV